MPRSRDPDRTIRRRRRSTGGRRDEEEVFGLRRALDDHRVGAEVLRRRVRLRRDDERRCRHRLSLRGGQLDGGARGEREGSGKDKKGTFRHVGVEAEQDARLLRKPHVSSFVPLRSTRRGQALMTSMARSDPSPFTPLDALEQAPIHRLRTLMPRSPGMHQRSEPRGLTGRDALSDDCARRLTRKRSWRKRWRTRRSDSSTVVLPGSFAATGTRSYSDETVGITLGDSSNSKLHC